MEEEVFTTILRLGQINRKRVYSSSEAKTLENALKGAVTHHPYNRQTTKATLLGIARFFRTCGGFTVEKWRLSPTVAPPDEELPPKLRELRETIRRRLEELDRK